jgi:hypothetical protein
LEELLLVAGIVFSILIVGSCLVKTSHNKKNRFIAGILLILSVLTYPIFVPFFGGFGGLAGVGSLMVFYFILLVGGLITVIAGFFTKSEAKTLNLNKQ